MEEFFKVLVVAGPAGIITFLFLVWDYKKGVLFNDSITKLAQSVSDMQATLAGRPCLWETTAQKLVDKMQELIIEAAKVAAAEAAQAAAKEAVVSVVRQERLMRAQ